MVYLAALLAVLAHLLLYPARWEEERWSVGLLTALHVRELVLTSRALWRTGQRWCRHWKRRRRAQRAILHLSAGWRAWIVHLLPESEPPPWAEQAAFAALRVSRACSTFCPRAPVRRSSAACAGGTRCTVSTLVRPPCASRTRTIARCGRRYACPVCSLQRGREVTFSDLHGTLLEHSHLDVRAWLWVAGESIARIHQELGVNRKTAERLVRLFQLILSKLRV